jgi:Tol biopolymer transport system component
VRGSDQEGGDPGIRPGARVGHYDVLNAIGAGGMGEVWKARDTILDRDVALKALPGILAADPTRLQRLEREAKLLAVLNHPNIAAIYGLETWGRTRVLVLELVDGPTLEVRIARGPLPVDEAVSMALQIAEAIEAAHGKGIVHRDLKPANIKITPEGRIKVLDFGIAKAVEPESDGHDAATTLTVPGIAIGTPAYMAPEQARGEPADGQADIWSFGVVLYEMLTGRSPFRGKTTADTIALVLAAEPDLAALPPATPARVRRLLQRCLQKARRQRSQHIGDVRLELEEALSPGEEPAAASGAMPLRRRYLAWAVAMAIAAALALTGWFAGRREAPRAQGPSMTMSIPFVERPASGPVAVRHLAVSEDGSRIAYASSRRLWIRELNRREPRALVDFGRHPFFSPDGAWVGFFDDTGLKKAAVDGGSPVPLVATADRPAGATWNVNGTIVFATTEGLFRVSADGGEATRLIGPDQARKERIYAWPHFLPDGQSLLYTIVPQGAAADTRIAVLNLRTLESRVLVNGGTAPVFQRTGQLLYATGSTLKAVPFDPATGQTSGEAVSLPDIAVHSWGDTGAADFAVSQSGTLVYLPASTQNDAFDLRSLRWIDRQGREEPLPIKPDRYAYPRVSPDGTRVALDIVGAAGRDIWILNLDRMSLTRLTDGPTEDMLPVWARDSQRVFFGSDRSGNFDIYSQAADGASAARVEFASQGFQVPLGFTPDGTRLLVYENFQDTALLDLAQPTRLQPLLDSEFDQTLAEVSPDGKWIAYESNESGNRLEVFIRPFPDVAGRREQVSTEGGRFPVWAPDGSAELSYIDLDGAMMTVAVTLSPRLALGRATRVYQGPKPGSGRSGTPYDRSPKDGRFLVARQVTPSDDDPTQVQVVLNAFGQLHGARN